MGIKRTSHAVYDTICHLVWAPKYRKWILRGNIRERVKNIFKVTTELIKRYIEYHRTEEKTPSQLELF